MVMAISAAKVSPLARSNRDLEQFAYVASHDLQEPLRKIRTFGDRLEMKCQDMLDETGRECVQRMQNAAARMQELIDGLLALSRVTTAGQRLRARRPGADRARGGLRPGGADRARRRPRGSGQPAHDPGRPPADAAVAPEPDRQRPEVPPRRGAARRDRSRAASCRPRAARGRQSPADEQCRITVEDNGIGFDEQYRERIFGIFQRLHPRDVYEGTGIGLAMCRKIVEHHGGKITAHSTPGKGSVFEVLLPVVQAKRDEAKHEEAGTWPGTWRLSTSTLPTATWRDSRPRTILMADDDADDCLLVRDALRESGQPHELRVVRDGQELLDYLRRRAAYETARALPAPVPDPSRPENAREGWPRGPAGAEVRCPLPVHSRLSC